MQTMRESWTDERLDDLNGKVDRGFERIDGELREVRGDIKGLAAEMNTRLDSIQRTMVQAAVALSAAMLAGFGGLAGLIATQL